MKKKKENEQQAQSADGSASNVIAGKLIYQGTTTPVFPALIEAFDSENPGSVALGRAEVDQAGAFIMRIDRRPKKVHHQVELYAFDGDSQRLLSNEPIIVRLGSEAAGNITFEVGPRTGSESLSDDIEGLQKGLALKIPRSLTEYLERSGIRTIGDIRRTGGLGQDASLPVPADQTVVRILDSLGALSVLPSDIKTNAALASSGMNNVLDVANSTTEAIADAVAHLPSTIPPERIHAIAQDQTRVLISMIFEAQVDAAFEQRSDLPKALQDVLPQTCGCSECQSAMSPIAYLADLLDYAIHHLRNNGQSVTLTFLQERFHQPFRDLPTSCAELDRKVRRMRICIEILRKHLAVRAPTRYPEILEAAYRTLLENIGTTYDEVRQVSRHGKQEQRLDLMTRLMLPTTITLDPLVFQATVTLDALFKDPYAPAGDPMGLSEEWLNEIFGLRNTTLEPLAEALDPQADVPQTYPHLLRWQRRFLWDQWKNEDYSQQSAPLDGRPIIDPDVIDLPDLKDVTSNPISRAQRTDRTLWSVLDFLEDRQYWTRITISELRAALAGTPAGLSGRLTALLQQLQSPATSFPQITSTGMEGLTFSATRSLYLSQLGGANVVNALQQLKLTTSELEGLGRVLELAVAGDPILTSEWDDFYSIIIGRLKRFGFHALWKEEERQVRVVIDLEPLTGLTLSPHHFQMRSVSVLGANTEWRATLWRSTDSDRRRWEEVLQARVDRAQNLVTVLQGAVDAAEVVELPEIRNLLLRIAQPPGVFLTDSTKRLTDRYQIDFEEGACSWTTRVAQATQTLQGILFGARNGLLDDPALTLDDNTFDNIWQWLGSFSTWKAAVLVWLHPEVALRPTLRSRQRQSQGFVEFITSLRSAGKVTLTSAKSALAVYEQYFTDVCSLEDGVCVLAPIPGPATGEFFTYLIARSSSGRLYWSYFDLNDEQSHWRRLELPFLDEEQEALKLFGAAYLTGRAGECYLYFFGKQAGAEADRIVFARTNLRENADWSELRWSTGALKGLPKPPAATEASTRFEFARLLMDRGPSDSIKLSVWLSEQDAYVRALNPTGLAWEDADFKTVPLVGAWQRLGRAARNGADFTCNTQAGPGQIPVQFILAGDFDRDGRDEIVIVPTGPLSTGIWVMKFDTATQQWRHLSPSSQDPISADLTDTGSFRFALAGDFDGDGYPEIAIAPNLAGPSLGDRDNVGFRVRKFDPGTGTWRSLGRSQPPYAFGEFGSTSWHVPSLTSRFAVAGDFDHDGRDEIAVAVSPIRFVEFPVKFCSNAFIFFDLELGAGGDHVWKQLRDDQGNDALLCDGKADSPFWRDYDSPFSRFAITGKFRGANGPTLLVVGKMKRNSDGNDEDRNLGNDFWVYRWDGTNWVRENDLDCGDVAVAAKFGVVGDFDGDGVPEAAIAQDAILPGSNEFGFWIEKMDAAGAWNPMPELKYGNQSAIYAAAGDFDGDGADEIAVVTPDVWQSNIRVFDFNNGAWSALAATNANVLSAGVFTSPGPVSVGAVPLVTARLLAGGVSDQLIALTQPETDNTGRAYAFATTITGSWSTPCSKPEIKPALSIASPILVEPEVEVARQLNARVPAALGSLKRRSNRDYLDELLFFVQLELVNRLRESGLYRDALDRCRIVYDYAVSLNERVIAAKLRDNQSLSVSVYQQWLKDTLDPHAIAETRKNSYLKYTIVLICNCLIDWADAEFARANAESVPRARELYERALELLNLPEIRQKDNYCAELLDQLTKTIGEGELAFAYEPVFREIDGIDDPVLLAALTQTIATISRSGLPLQNKVEKSLTAVRSAVRADDSRTERTFDGLWKDASDRLASTARLLVAEPDRWSALAALAGESSLDGGPRELGRYQSIPAPKLLFCVPPNPAIARLRRHAELCLRKIRECKNIAGLDLCLDPYGVTTADLVSADSGQPLSTVATGLQPMPYHYVTLIERTKQLVELARQLESSMLQFISSAEQARYEELKARQDLELTQAGVQLKDLQVLQASDAATSASLQRDRAQLQASHFSELLTNGWTVNEQLQVTNLAVADAHQHAAAIASWIGIWFGQSNYATAISTSGSAWSMNSQFHGLLASFERRNQEWQFEKRVAEQDVRIGQQQIMVARDQLAIAGQERAIAALQADYAQTIVNFLAGKFLNADLYDWMADVLEQVYRFFLQQATQLARMAELQLSFERQEPLVSIIKADYWERPSTELTPDVGASSTGTNNVRGLTGSARLLRDVFELDQYAFAKNQRKQQLSETLSLAQLDPFAFQLFRQTGRLPFATPMALFDLRFPGHYLRLIKRVRTSVVALIPPTMGIRATLSSIGPTRVVVGPEAFRSVTIRRESQYVALTSPANATGLFDLDAQPELLVPFEGLGVDGNWVFDMPKPSNPFDYDAIADVLVTFDYTALHSPDYQEEVLKTMDRSFRADRAFSFRQEFADAWYDLNNPEIIDEPDVPMTVSFRTRRIDFPPNIKQLSIEQVLLQFRQLSGAQQVVNIEEFYFVTNSGQTVPGNLAERAASSTSDGLFSTRRGAWSAFAGSPIDGDLTWTLKLPDLLKSRFKNREITDIFLVISYRGLLDYAV
jgi:hypothetical protein